MITHLQNLSLNREGFSRVGAPFYKWTNYLLCTGRKAIFQEARGSRDGEKELQVGELHCERVHREAERLAPSHLPPCLVQAPSRLTTFRWWPMWVKILSSVISALYSLAVAPSV